MSRIGGVVGVVKSTWGIIIIIIIIIVVVVVVVVRIVWFGCLWVT